MKIFSAVMVMTMVVSSMVFASASSSKRRGQEDISATAQWNALVQPQSPKKPSPSRVDSGSNAPKRSDYQRPIHSR